MRSSDLKWWCVNDSKVTPIKDVNQVLKQRAYILFYKHRIINTKEKLKKEERIRIDQRKKMNILKKKE